MGLGVGGVDSVVPVYSSELSPDHGRGKAMAQEFQSNIFGLNMAFAINLVVTRALGKSNEWAWPESPRWFVFHDRKEDAKASLKAMYGQDEGQEKADEFIQAASKEQDETVSYMDMLTPGRDQWHPTVITIMGQVNQALTGYGGEYPPYLMHSWQPC